MGNQMDSDLNQGAPGVTPQAPSGGGDQRNSPDELDRLATLLEQRLLDKLEGRFRTAQGDKDRRFADMEKKFGSLRDVTSVLGEYQEILNKVNDPEVAADRLLLRRLLAQEDQGTPPVSQSAPVNAPQEPSDNTSAILASMGLQANDPEVAVALRDASSEIDRIGKLHQVAIKRQAAQQAPPNPAAVQQAGTGGAPTRNLDQEYYTEVSKIRRGDVDAQWRTLQKYRKIAKDTGNKFSL